MNLALAGAQQAGDLMQDLKTGHLLRASPRAQFVGQLVGSAVSVVFAVLAYALFTTAYAVPGPVLAAPMAMVCACTAHIPLASAHTTGGGQMWIDMAKVVNGESLMSHVIGFCVAGALLAIAAVLVRACVGGSSKVSSFIPNGIAFAVVRLHTGCLGARLEYLTDGGTVTRVRTSRPTGPFQGWWGRWHSGGGRAVHRSLTTGWLPLYVRGSGDTVAHVSWCVAPHRWITSDTWCSSLLGSCWVKESWPSSMRC